MKTLQILLFLTTLVFCQDSKPIVFIEQTEFDFGEINQGETVSHDFKIENKGNDLLIITRVRASCGCTAAEPKKKELKPNESTTINVEFNSTGREGEQKKHVYISTNDPENETVRITFKANITSAKKKVEKKTGAELTIEKRSHNFGDLKQGDKGEITLKLYNTGNEKLYINRIKTTCGCTAAILENKVIAPGEFTNLNIELDTNNRKGKLTRTVAIYSNDINNNINTIRIYANILEGK